jgi:hypothetical protein
VATPAGLFSEEGSLITFQKESDGTPSTRSCGCYEMQGCNNYLPVGAGGLSPNPCPDVRDHGIRGGFGGVRIKFVPSS